MGAGEAKKRVERRVQSSNAAVRSAEQKVSSLRKEVGRSRQVVRQAIRRAANGRTGDS